MDFRWILPVFALAACDAPSPVTTVADSADARQGAEVAADRPVSVQVEGLAVVLTFADRTCRIPADAADAEGQPRWSVYVTDCPGIDSLSVEWWPPLPPPPPDPRFPDPVLPAPTYTGPATVTSAPEDWIEGAAVEVFGPAGFGLFTTAP